MNRIQKIFLLVLAFLTLFLLPAGALPASAAEVTDFRWTVRNDGNPPFIRMVLDLSQSVKASAALDKSGQNLEVVLNNSNAGKKIKDQYNMYKQNVDFATFAGDDGDLRLDVALNTPMRMKDIKIFPLKRDKKADKPHRLVIDIPQTSAAAGASASSKTSYNATKSEKDLLRGKVICIDPGHGGTDVGAIGRLDGNDVYEKDINFSIAKPLRDMLQAAGAKVIMTRDSDVDVAGPYAEDVAELQARCDVANKAGADAFVSIHIDSFSNSSIDGTTAYYYPKNGNDLLLAQAVHNAVISRLAIPDRGVRSNDLYVNVHANMPSTLVEMGFISNTHRLKMLTSSWGPKSIAQAIYKGLADYFRQVG